MVIVTYSYATHYKKSIGVGLHSNGCYGRRIFYSLYLSYTNEADGHASARCKADAMKPRYRRLCK